MLLTRGLNNIIKYKINYQNLYFVTSGKIITFKKLLNTRCKELEPISLGAKSRNLLIYSLTMFLRKLNFRIEKSF